MRKVKYATSLLLLLGLLNLAAFPLTVSDKTAGLCLEQRFSATEKSNEDGGARELRVNRSKTSLSHAMPWQDGFLGAKISYEYSDYDSVGSPLPISVGREIALQLTYLKHYQNQWSLLHISNFSSGAEKNVSFDDAVMYNGLLAMRYHLSETLVLGFGLYTGIELERDNFIYPVLTLDWQITERLHMYTANGVFFDYDLFNDDSTIIGLDVEYQTRQYRLSGNGDQQAMRERNGALGLSLTYYLTENAYWKVYGEYLFNRRLKVYQDDSKKSTHSIENGFNLGIAAGLEF